MSGLAKNKGIGKNRQGSGGGGITSAPYSKVEIDTVSQLNTLGFTTIKLSDLAGTTGMSTYITTYLYPRFVDTTSSLYGEPAYIKWDDKQVAKVVSVPAFTGGAEVFVFDYNGRIGALVEDATTVAGAKIVWKDTGETKLLNVVQTGTLTRDGAVFTGFGSSNYLQLGDNVKDQYFLPSGTAIKDFTSAISSGQSFEFITKVKFNALNKMRQAIVATTTDNRAFILQLYNNNHINILWNVAGGSSWTYDIDITTYSLSVDTWYWFKFSFDGTQYKLDISTDGTTYTNLNTTAEIRALTSSLLKYGVQSVNDSELNGYIDLSGCKITVSGNLWWSGVSEFVAVGDIDLAEYKKKTATKTLTTSSTQLEDNTIFNGGELASVTITAPSSYTADFISEINFSSGVTATTFTAPNTIKFSGDNCENGIFTPAVSSRYYIMFYYDGASVQAVVKKSI